MKKRGSIKRLAPVAVGLLLLMIGGLAPPAMGAEEPVPAGPPPVSGPAVPDTPAPMTDIHDIRPPVPMGVDLPGWAPALLALAVVIALAVFWWWRKRRQPGPVATIVPELPPELIAKAALDRIGDVRGQDGKAFYFQLSAILRQYVHGRFGIGAPEMTTEEFVPCIDRLSIDRELARQLKQLCRAMDPVKFAGQRVEEKQMESDLFFVRGFVRQTTALAENPASPNDAPRALPSAEA